MKDIITRLDDEQYQRRDLSRKLSKAINLGTAQSGEGSKLAMGQKGESQNMARKRVSVTSESSTGRNQKFHDHYIGADMTRSQFVDKIKQGEYPNHHIRKINGVETPVSNPDQSQANNLD